MPPQYFMIRIFLVVFLSLRIPAVYFLSKIFPYDVNMEHYERASFRK